MAVKKKKPSEVIDKIKVALDGRTQRWLALRVKMDEPDLSNKLNGVREFSDVDKAKISEALSISL